jgi:hypothetical protein
VTFTSLICYQMVTVTTDDVISPELIATEGPTTMDGSMISPMSHYRNRSQEYFIVVHDCQGSLTISYTDKIKKYSDT